MTHEVLANGDILIRPAKLKSRERRRRQVEGLFKRQRGLCFYCNCPMWLAPAHEHTKRQPPNMATLEHLDSRFSAERGTHEGQIRRVLACLACNNARADAEQAAQPRELLRALASRGKIKGTPQAQPR